MIIYGGSKEQVEKQLVCEHQWYERIRGFDEHQYRRCLKCDCVDRDEDDCKEYEADKYFDGLAKRHFEVLRELKFARERRADAVRIIEEKRKEIQELKRCKKV